MRTITLVLLLCFHYGAIAQNTDCFKNLYQKGMNEFDKKNYDAAILKWQSAKDNCPDISNHDKKTLEDWIKKAKDLQKYIPKDTTATSQPTKIIYKYDTIVKTKIIHDTVFITKRDTIYKDKIVEKKVYIDKPVEKIIYVENPEPYHQYGKGNGKITLFKSCNCYNLKFWIDGEYAGTTRSIFSSGDPECDNTNAVSKIVLSGKHRIQGQDDEGHNWDFYVTVYEDQCLVQGVVVKWNK